MKFNAWKSLVSIALIGGAFAPATVRAGNVPPPAWPLYVGDRSTYGVTNASIQGDVPIFNSSGTQTGNLNDTSSSTGLGSAEGMAVDANYLYAAGAFGTINVVDKVTGASHLEIQTQIYGQDQAQCIGLTLANGNIYVVTYGATTGYSIERYDAATGSFLSSVVGGTTTTFFGLAATADGHIIADFGKTKGTDGVYQYNSDLSAKTTLVAPGAGTSGGRFAGVSTDVNTGNFFVSETLGAGTGPSVVHEYDASGNNIGNFTFTNNQWFTAVGPDGNLYAAFIDDNRIDKITLNSGVLDGNSVDSTFIKPAGTYPKSLVFDISSNVTPPPSTVPEPSTMITLFSGIVGLVGYRRFLGKK